MADDDLQSRIDRLGQNDSLPPDGASERPSRLSIRFTPSKGKIKWGRTILAIMVAFGSVAEVVLELVSKDGPIAKLVNAVCH